MSIIRRHPAFRAVARLAVEVLLEHFPDEPTCMTSEQLTLELYRFLTIKQLVLRTRPSEAAEDSLQVSPGFLVDALWHAVLMESEVREALDALLGGHVPHSAADARHLSDEQKLARQLTALNLMAFEGWTSNPRFWQQPGTAMHKVERVDADGVVLFFAHGMPVPDVAEVTRTFLSSVGLDYCTGAFLATMNAAYALAAADSAAGGGRPPNGCVPPAPPGAISFIVKHLTGKLTPVTVPADSTVAHVMQYIQQVEGIPTAQQRLVTDRKQLSPYEFLEEAGVTDGLVVHLVVRLGGC